MEHGHMRTSFVQGGLVQIGMESAGEFIKYFLWNWNKRAEIGCETHPDYWRMGYTSEAIKEVLKYSFEKPDLYRIGAVTFPESKASNQLLEKLGFQREGLPVDISIRKVGENLLMRSCLLNLRDSWTIE